MVCMISGFHHEKDENRAFLGYYAASSGKYYLSCCVTAQKSTVLNATSDWVRFIHMTCESAWWPVENFDIIGHNFLKPWKVGNWPCWAEIFQNFYWLLTVKWNIYRHGKGKSLNLYHPTWPYAGLWEILVNSIAYHMLVCVCLLGSVLQET